MRALLLILIVLAGLHPHQAIATSSQAGSAPFKPSSTGAGNSYAPVFSADGRFAAFLSHANNLVTNDDRQPHLDLFLRDLAASNTVLVSVGSNGLGGANNNVITFALSTNASVISFESAASNLATGDTNRAADIFVGDLAAGTTTLVSRNADGTTSGNGPSTGPLISADGRYVIFESAASNLVTNDFNGTNDIFIHDLATHTTSLVSVNADGTASPNGPSFSPSISEDGLTVAFVTRATNLVNGITNHAGEIYIRNVAAGTNLWGTGSYLELTAYNVPFVASAPILSADGRYVGFRTYRGQVVRYDTQRPTNVVIQSFPPNSPPPPFGGAWRHNYSVFHDNPRISPASDTATNAMLMMSADGRWIGCVASNGSGGVPVVRRFDFETFAFVPILLTEEGTVGGPYFSYRTNQLPVGEEINTNLMLSASTNIYAAPASNPVMSADGQRFLFVAPTMLPGSGSNVLREPSGLWFRDMATNVCALLSTNRAGQPGPDLSGIVPALSSDGALVAWDSPDPNLVEDDLNGAWDVFTRGGAIGETRLVSARHAGLPEQTGRALSWLTPGAVSGDGRRVALLTYDSSLGRDDTNRLADAVVRDLEIQTNFTLSAPFLVFNSTVLATSMVVSAQLSVDGRYALFVRNGGVYSSNSYWHDFVTGTNRWIAGELGNQFEQKAPATMSSDGKLVAFASKALNVGAILNIYACDPLGPIGPNCCVSVNSIGATANGHSISPLISADNCWLAFQSLATDITPDTTLGQASYQVFARDLLVNKTKIISYTTSASPQPEGSSANFALAGGGGTAVFSADARHLVFEHTGSNVIYRHRLLEGDILTLTTNGATVLTNRARPTNDLVCTACANPSVSADGRFVAYESRGTPTNIFVRDLQSGVSELVSVNAAGGAPGNSRSFTPLISWDARYVVFASKANDLVPDDTNRATDVFVRDRLLGVTHCLSRHPVTGRPGSRASSNPVMSADGRSVAFQSFADELAPGDYNETRDVFVVRLGGGDGDGDGMDDDWEIGWFNTLARDGSGDFDGDGASDLAEFRAGTNPSDGASVLRVLTLMTGGNPSQVTLLWSASPGRRYRVQYLPQIGGAWSDVSDEITAAGTSAFAVVVRPPGSTMGFYRVLLVE